MSNVVDLAQELIRRKSVTPEDGGCQQLIATRLQRHGFKATHLRYGAVDNLWCRRGDTAPLFVLAGHTDVVPTGPLDTWDADPFTASISGNKLYGRGAADMKGSLAAMVVAIEQFVSDYPDHEGSIALLLSSDEEGLAIDGTRRVVAYLHENDVKIDWCVVGEPSSNATVGDQIRIGRRGSLTGKLHVFGVQGHVAYHQLADNPIHSASAAIYELCTTHWDDGNAFYPQTSFQISNICAGTGADNVIPGALDIVFNFRFCTESSEQSLRKRVTDILDRHEFDYRLDWHLSGQPFLTKPGKLIDAARDAIRSITGIEPVQSTAGGTSDGRFIAPTGAAVIELGPVNATIHKVNECVDIAELDTLVQIYIAVLKRLLMS